MLSQYVAPELLTSECSGVPWSSDDLKRDDDEGIVAKIFHGFIEQVVMCVTGEGVVGKLKDVSYELSCTVDVLLEAMEDAVHCLTDVDASWPRGNY